MTKRQRGEKVASAARSCLKACGVPRPTASITALAAGYNGFFDFQTWTLKLNENMFDGYMDTTNIHPYFVNTLEIVYHESRHCEQWWHMCRFHALGRQAADLTRDLAVPNNIASRACRHPMKSTKSGADPMLDLTRKWFESVYGAHGGMQRGITLGALALKRSAEAGKFVSMDNFHAQRHAEYSGNLPEEVDAWGIQKLVRAKL